MTCIDAAIIRALVEHIGGNPDSVPDGTIGGVADTSSFLDATWDDDGAIYTFTLPEGQKLAVGSIIRIIEKPSTISNFLVIEEIPSTNNNAWYTMFKFPIDFSNPRIFEQRLRFDGERYQLDDFYIDAILKPDNKTTGVMSNHSYASILELLVSIINGILAMPKAA